MKIVAAEEGQPNATAMLGGQSMSLERLEEAYRMLTMEDWKFVYIQSDEMTAFVNCMLLPSEIACFRFT